MLWGRFPAAGVSSSESMVLSQDLLYLWAELVFAVYFVIARFCPCFGHFYGREWEWFCAIHYRYDLLSPDFRPCQKGELFLIIENLGEYMNKLYITAYWKRREEWEF